MPTDEDFEDLVVLARHYGIDEAIRRMSSRCPADEVAQLLADYERRKQSAQLGYPPKIIAVPGREPWYAGPLADDPYWPQLKRHLEDEVGLPRPQVDKIDEASTKVVAYTRDPTSDTWRTQGLVVGYVQSGKTTNFTSVIAKAVDVGYNLVIVLSGIHNGLRRQTQERLDAQLCELSEGGWITTTTLLKDFVSPPYTLESVLPAEGDRKAVLCVVKKNAAVLRKLVAWLERAARSGGLRRVKALVIDDEADQASVATAKINPLIRNLLAALPRCTFIGYTATPFANVLIDPAAQDLYPKDFILNLPQPDGYFGTQMIFGRDEVPSDLDEVPIDGYDMVRVIPDTEAAALRPQRGQTFEPTLTASLEEAVLWFWMATAARRWRVGDGHSTMLIHTSMKTAVHEAFKGPLLKFRDETTAEIGRQDPLLVARLQRLWDEETARVPATDFGLEPVSFDSMIGQLEAVVGSTTVVLDNSKSLERLTYGPEPVTAIAVGGNTLSRGLTLEGLVVSYFIRAANAYDTLLQMGRWFGFRRGYEDMPRIYMTKELREWFRHLATVEHEIRLDIAVYEQQGLTPQQFGVRIRTHPTLLVTQKLGAAMQAYTSYGGRRVQVRYFRRNDADWLRTNRLAAAALLAAAQRDGAPRQERADGTVIWRDVSVAHIKSFLNSYLVHPDSPDLSRDLLLAYIDTEVAAGSLGRWSVAVMGNAPGSGSGDAELAGVTFKRIVRARLRDRDPDVADIKTLMSKEHRVVDMDIDHSEARNHPEEKLMQLRNSDPVYGSRGLLLLYPIDPTSQPGRKDSRSREPLDACDDVIGLGLVFPGNADTSVQNSYIAVDLSTVAIEEEDDQDDVIENDAEDEPGS